jgi:hypothetical protein
MANDSKKVNLGNLHDFLKAAEDYIEHEPIEKANRLKMIEAFEVPTPVFNPNPKYCSGIYEGFLGYIGDSDAREFRLIIRAIRRDDPMNPLNGTELKSYPTAESIWEDGWTQ